MTVKQIKDNDPTPRAPPKQMPPLPPIVLSWFVKAARMKITLTYAPQPTASTEGPSQLHPDAPQTASDDAIDHIEKPRRTHRRGKTADFSRNWEGPDIGRDETDEAERSEENPTVDKIDHTTNPHQTHQRRKTVDFTGNWEWPAISLEDMHEFQRFGKTLSVETVENIAALMEAMFNWKHNETVLQFAKFADGRFGISERSWAKFVRVFDHLRHVAYLSALDRDTFHGAVIGVRLALFPKLVEGDELAGKQGLESTEVRLTRKFICKLLADWGFNPSTGLLRDEEKRQKMIDRQALRKELHLFKQQLDRPEEIKKAEAKRKDYFLNGFESLAGDD